MALLIGEVEIPRVPLTINKSDFDRDSAPWVDIEGRLHRLLTPIARQLSRQTESPPPPSSIRSQGCSAGKAFIEPGAPLGRSP